MLDKKNIEDSLKRLKEKYGVISIKAEFEAEGSRKDELIMLREFVEKAGLGFIIKIGGCEAVHDLDQSKLLYATGVMAPMIETAFAMKKYIKAYRKVYGEDENVERIINAETVTCQKNYDEILECGKGFLTGVTVGRSDLSASMGIDKSNIEGDEVFAAAKEMIVKSKEEGLVTNFGGNIGVESIPFIIRMSPFIDRFETRKVVLKPSNNPEKLKEAIKEALRFELLYLNFKSNYYSCMAKEDDVRKDRLRKQINTE